MEEAKAEASAELGTAAGAGTADLDMSDIERELSTSDSFSSLDDELKEK